MLTMFSPASLEAQKLISVSIGKINASRVTRTGTSLHKSLLVASVLHRARNVYLEEERERAARYPCPPSPELTVTPVCHVNPASNIDTHNSDHTLSDKENRLQCHEDQVAVAERVGEESRLPLGEANTGNNNVTHTTTTTTTVTSLTNTCTITTTTSSSSSRKRRRVSDQETAAAISSILPKRLRSELKEDSLRSDFNNAQKSVHHHHHTEDLTITPISREAADTTKPQSEAALEPTSPPDVSSRLAPPAEEDDDDQAAATPVPEDVSSRLSPGRHQEDVTAEQDVRAPTAAEPDSATDDGDKKGGGGSSSEDSDSDGEDSASDTSASSCEEEMEVDQLTSLVSYFGFSQGPKQADYRLVPSLHSQPGPHAVALTA